MLWRAFVALAFLAVLVPSTGSAGVRIAGREEPLAGARTRQSVVRTTAPRPAPFAFNLAGLHWQGSGSVWFRTRAERGPWTPWRPAMPETEDQPDPGSPETAAREGWRLGNPWWTGRATRIQYRLEGEVSRLRAYFLWSPASGERRSASASTPLVSSRAEWGADESIVRAPPSYAAVLRLAVVHHTAGRNDYSPEEAAAIVRGIQTYHVRANGWNDIGYNFLVDRYGRVYEGRAGGIDRNVVGAHAAGFNGGSAGVAILGTYEGEAPTPEAEAALGGLLAWRLDVAHVDPLSQLAVVSGGNGLFPAGTTVMLRAVTGHRDVGSTVCPGAALHGRLPAVADAAAAAGLPKLYEPAASPATLAALPDGTYRPILFTARLSSPLPWSVTVADTETGAAVSFGSGSGEAVSWTWDGKGPDGRPVDPGGRYTVTIASAADLLPATLTLGPSLPAAPGLARVEVTPGVLTPNGDGDADAAVISFELAEPAQVRIRLLTEAGAKVATVLRERGFPAGPGRVAWDGSTVEGAVVPDGSYQIGVRARKGKKTVVARVPIVVDRTLAGLRLSRGVLSPNGDGRKDAVAVVFELARPARVAVLVRRGSHTAATLLDADLAAGAQRLVWDGRAGPSAAEDGAYDLVVRATTELGTRRLAAAVVVDTTPPVVAVLSATSRGRTTRVRFALSERARVRIWTDAGAETVERGPGESAYVARPATKRVRLVAWDPAGNASRPARVSLRR